MGLKTYFIFKFRIFGFKNILGLIAVLVSLF